MSFIIREAYRFLFILIVTMIQSVLYERAISFVFFQM